MRALLAALLAAALLAAAAAPALASSQPRALIAFLPASPDAGRQVLIDELAARPALALGLTSPTLGGFSPQQMGIDLGQGARISTRAYKSKLPPFALVPVGGGAQIAGWEDEVKRADAAPGDVTPGLLPTTIERAGGSVGYAGVTGAPRNEALAATNEAGRIEHLSEGPAATLADRALALWRPGSLVVTRLPEGSDGGVALDKLLAARKPSDFVYVVEAPPERGLRLLPTGVAGPGYAGVLRSATTRLTGLVAATDVAPTVLDALGLPVPKKMQGEQIESRTGHGAAYIERIDRRLSEVLTHRSTTLRVVLLAWILLLGAMWLLRRREGVRTAGRVIFLGAIWLPALALLTAALAPSDAVEAVVLAAGSLLLGAVSDRLLPWPAAPLIPAAVSFLAHTVDLALGSHLISLSLAGPNPKGGSRFFGIGNELEIVLSVTVLVGTAAGLTLLPRRLAPRGFAIACLLGALVVGAGRLGADVGGVITFGAGGAAAVVASLPGGVTRRALLLAVVVPILAVAALIGLDLLVGGGAHLTRTLSNSSGPGDLAKIVLRRWRLSLAGLTNGTRPLSTGLALLVLVVAVVRREALLAPLEGAREEAFAAGLVGVFFATLVATVANDSGPVIMLLGAASLLLAAGYVHGVARTPDRRPLG
jgi:hypothetical protein